MASPRKKPVFPARGMLPPPPVPPPSFLPPASSLMPSSEPSSDTPPLSHQTVNTGSNLAKSLDTMFVQTQSLQPAAPTSEPDLKQLFKPPVLDAEARRRARMRFNRASRQGRGTRDRENCIRNEAMIAAISGPQSSAARTNWFNAWLNLSEDSDKLLEFWMLDEEIKK